MIVLFTQSILVYIQIQIMVENIVPIVTVIPRHVHTTLIQPQTHTHISVLPIDIVSNATDKCKSLP